MTRQLASKRLKIITHEDTESHLTLPGYVQLLQCCPPQQTIAW